MALRFGRFVFDGERRQLLTGAAEVHVTPKAFDLLALLLEERPRAVAKSRLQAQLWPRTAVMEGNLANLVGELRAALGDPPRHSRYVRTVYGYGYAFGGAVAEDTAEGRVTAGTLRLSGDKREIPLFPGENLLGRSKAAAVYIEAEGVSRRHARILVEEGRVVLEDLGSKNGTWHRDRRIEKPVPLVSGDEIRLGRATLRFRAAGESESTTTLDEL